MILPMGDVVSRCHELDSHVKYTFIDRFFLLKVEYCKYCIITKEESTFKGIYRAN